MADLKLLKKGEILMHEGQDAHSMYFVQKGTLQVSKLRGQKKVVLGNVFSGELVGEVSFIDRAPRSATVTAQDDCELIEIPAEKFEDFLATQPTWVRALIKTLNERLRKTSNLVKV